MSETQWLTEEEQRAWRGWLSASQLITEVTERQLRDNGIPLGYYEILVRLSEAPGRSLRMSDLAEVSLSSRSRLSHAVARLEEQGLISRVDCPSDRRGQIAALTDAGFGMLEAAAPGHVGTVRSSIFDALTDEQVTALADICSTIVEHLTPITGPSTVPPCPTRLAS